MGQKVHPIGFRLGIIRTWESNWYAEKDYAQLLHEDLKLRDYLKERLHHAGISKVEIERAAGKAKINIFAARPGIIIGKKGSEVEALKKELAKLTDKEVFINIQEVRKPEIDAQLVAENVALQLVRRVAFRRAMKKAVTQSLKFGAQGIHGELNLCHELSNILSTRVFSYVSDDGEFPCDGSDVALRLCTNAA